MDKYRLSALKGQKIAYSDFATILQGSTEPKLNDVKITASSSIITSFKVPTLIESIIPE